MAELDKTPEAVIEPTENMVSGFKDNKYENYYNKVIS
jgi:hypothetical protein